MRANRAPIAPDSLPSLSLKNRQTIPNMLELSEAQFQTMAIHRVGNKSREEGVLIAPELYHPEDYLLGLLKKYFFKPFKSLEDSWKFTHEDGHESNLMWKLCAEVFEAPDLIFQHSAKIVNHLYEQSEHPHIKPGEVYVAYLTDCVVEGELVDGIGIFKSETRDTFLKVLEAEKEIELLPEQGINIKKLDKGAIIFNTEQDSGFRVFTVDNNNYDAQYWIEDFLNLETDQNEVFATRAVIDLAQEFAHEVVGTKEDRKEEVMFVNKTMDFMNQNEQFTMEEFTEQVIGDNKDYAKEFKSFKQQYEVQNEIAPIEEFDIAPATVKKAKSQVKKQIDLDTNIQIKLNFNDLESGDKFIEKGFDQDRGMYFYTVYFNREV